MTNLPGAPGFPMRGPALADGPLLGATMRLPPANLEAEQALLGALLANNRALERVADFLRAEHFADPLHGRIYAAICRRVDAGQVADVVSLRGEFEHDPLIGEAGGVGYLAQLLAGMVGIINAGEYGRLVLECWRRRLLIETGEGLVNEAFSPPEGEGAEQIIERAEAGLLALAEGGGAVLAQESQAVAADVVRHMQAAILRRGGLVGIPTGYAGLDYLTGGMEGSQLIIIGGRPAMGKTAIGVGIAARAAAQGARVYFWGGEMSAGQVMMRIVAAEARLPLAAVRRGAVAEGGSLRPLEPDGPELAEAAEAARRVAGLPLRWDDQPSITVHALRARLRRHKRRFGLDLVVVDYLGLLRGSPEVARQGRYAEAGEISRTLKATAKELGVPVLALVQLNRALESRENKRPILADLRDSGDIEQDADTVWFIHREHYFLEKARPQQKPGEDDEKYFARLNEWQGRMDAEAGQGELIIAKQRQGETGAARLRWDGRRTWYFNHDEPEDAGALPAQGATA
jgi:replicative DNA helicase